jgi:Tat protein secretion system quality control protein TatD with DNase activity
VKATGYKFKCMKTPISFTEETTHFKICSFVFKNTQRERRYIVIHCYTEMWEYIKIFMETKFRKVATTREKKKGHGISV